MEFVYNLIDFSTFTTCKLLVYREISRACSACYPNKTTEICQVQIIRAADQSLQTFKCIWDLQTADNVLYLKHSTNINTVSAGLIVNLFWI